MMLMKMKMKIKKKLEVNFFTENQDFVGEYLFDSDSDIRAFLRKAKAKPHASGDDNWIVDQTVYLNAGPMTLFVQKGWLVMVGDL